MKLSQAEYPMKQFSPIVQKSVSIVGFSIMGCLVIYVAIDEGPFQILIILLKSSFLGCLAATYLLVVWFGFRSIQLLIFKGMSLKQKAVLLIQSISPFVLFPIIATLSGCLLLYFSGRIPNLGQVLFGVLLIIPAICYLIEGVVSGIYCLLND